MAHSKAQWRLYNGRGDTILPVFEQLLGGGI